MAGQLTIRELVTKWGFETDTKKLDQFNKNIETSKKKLDDFAENAGAMGRKLTLAFTLPIVGLASFSVKAASDAEEIQSKFNTVFKNIQTESTSTAKTLATNFGLSITKSKELLSGTGDLLTGFGFLFFGLELKEDHVLDADLIYKIVHPVKIILLDLFLIQLLDVGSLCLV